MRTDATKDSEETATALKVVITREHGYKPIKGVSFRCIASVEQLYRHTQSALPYSLCDYASRHNNEVCDNTSS